MSGRRGSRPTGEDALEAGVGLLDVVYGVVDGGAEGGALACTWRRETAEVQGGSVWGAALGEVMGKGNLGAGVRDVDVPRVREYQRGVYESAARFKVLICGRRWGKSKMALLCAVNGHGPVVDEEGERRHFRGAVRGGRIGWFVPSWEHVSGQEAWSDLKAATWRARVKVSEELRIVYLPGGGSVQVISAYDADAGRGIYLDGAIVDECSLQSERAWRNLRPTLSDYGGWALLCGTVPEDASAGSAGAVGGHWFAQLHRYAGSAAGQERGWATWRRPSWDNPQLSASDLEEARETNGLRYFLREYGAELLTAEGGVWKEEWLQRAYEPGEGMLPANLGEVQAMEILVDAAWKTGILHDWTVAQLWCRTPRGFCVVDELRGKWESPVMRRKVAEFRARWVREADRLGLSLPVVVEAVGGGLVAVQELKAACEFPVIEYEVRGSSKLARWEATSPEAEAGRVWHPPEEVAPWVPAWREELVGAPQLPHDDRCDVFAMAVQRLRQRSEAVHAVYRPGVRGELGWTMQRGGY